MNKCSRRPANTQECRLFIQLDAKPPSPAQQEGDSAQQRLNAGMRALAERDPVLARALADYGYPAPRQREAGFSGLVRIIVAQQISLAAANAIEAKLRLRFPELSAEECAVAPAEELRACGLSRPKVGYVQALAQEICEGRLRLEDLAALNNNELIERLTQLKGFGRWSAEIYALFCLGREDIFPAGDRALHSAIQRLYAQAEPLTANEAREFAERWKPYRSAASLFLWHCYRGNPA